jgi:hypothetical protein
MVRLGWGGSRWLAAVASVLAVACLGDWLYDRYADVPFWLRVLATLGQVVVAAGLAVLFVVRPWARTPPLDDLAVRAERAIPEFDHRIVTALQLNRPGAKTAGMSKMLIAEVTREAGEMAARHDLLKLVDYRRLTWAAGVLAPVALVLGGFVLLKPGLALVLLKRQLLLDAEIPRSVRLENQTQEVWPSGSEVTIRYRVSGRYDPEKTGVVRVSPEGQPTDDYPLAFEQENPDGSASYTAKLPPSSINFTFKARLQDGRTRTPGAVAFEPPPQVTDIEARVVLPEYLGKRPNGQRYTRPQPRGEVTEALAQSDLLIEAQFNKPVVEAWLVPIERGPGNKEVDRGRLHAAAIADDGQAAGWRVPTSPKLIGYRIELKDRRGFVSPAPARRGVRMLPDAPPVVEFKPEYVRDPDPTGPDGKGSWEDYRFDMPLGPSGRVMVSYEARSPMGISRANLRYRVIPRGGEVSRGDDVRVPQHPREDPNAETFLRFTLSRVTGDTGKLGKFVPEMGLFEKSGMQGQVEFYPHPSPNPDAEPGELVAGGRYHFEIGGLRKKLPDGTLAELAPGDTVEIYVEAYDKNPAPGRPAGYTEGARLKTVVTDEDARRLIRARDEAAERLQEKIRLLEAEQRGVFQPKKQ